MDLNILTYLGIMLLAALIARQDCQADETPECDRISGNRIADWPELFEDFE